MQVKTIIKLVIGTVLGVICLFSFGELYENNDANKIMVVQDAMDGELHWYTMAGIQPQWFGKVTYYPKREIYEFEIPVRFNDGGHATMIGSIQYEYPLDDNSLTKVHTSFGSSETVKTSLMKKIVDNAVYMSGPLMSSKESSAEKRNSLIHYVGDQIKYGVYKTISKDVKTIDAMTGAEKTVAVVEIVQENNSPLRQEVVAVLQEYNLIPSNFSISQLPYDKDVEEQIKKQQALYMDVLTAMADAKKAEQRVITVEKEGQANAAAAKWEQETIKAQKVTEAEQELEVQRLAAETAAQYKIEQTLRGEADAAYRKKVMEADGALSAKLEAWTTVNQAYAAAMGVYTGQWVPSVVMGADGTKQNNGAQAMIDLLSVKTAKDIGLDMTPKK